MNFLKFITLEERIVLDAAAVAVIHVDVSSAYDQSAPDVGTAWDKAYNNLQTALEQAASTPTTPEQIWVAGGTYTPTQLDTSPLRGTYTFLIPDLTQLYGGFVGGETDISQRSFSGLPGSNNLTILSGDIGTIGVKTDNTTHVVTLNNVNVTLDGFTIRDGYASNLSGNTAQNGGGIFIWGGNTVLENLTLTQNEAHGNVTGTGSGGALFAVLVGSVPIISMNRVLVDGNQADRNGGGIIMVDATATITNSLIQNNRTFTVNATTANQQGGGGIYGQNSIFDISHTTIQNNIARNVAGTAGAGGGISIAGPNARLTLTDSDILNNMGAAGGGITIAHLNGTPVDPIVTISDSRIKGNLAQIVGTAAGSRGGGIDNQGILTITNTYIENNTAINSAGSSGLGGGIVNAVGSPVAPLINLVHSFIIDNRSVQGGGINNNFGLAGIVNVSDNSIFSGNQAIRTLGAGTTLTVGAAVLNFGTFNIDNSVVEGNLAFDRGGGLAISTPGKMTINNSVIRDNVAQNLAGTPLTGGGALYNGSTATDGFVITNSTFSNNSAVQFGGVFFGLANSKTSISNSDINDNSAGVNGGAIYLLGGTTGTILSINNARFNHNSAGQDGGAIYGLGTGATGIINASVTNSTFTNNLAGNNGGAIALVNSSSGTGSTFTGNNFNGNHAGLSGSGMYVLQSLFTASANTFDPPYTVNENSAFSANLIADIMNIVGSINTTITTNPAHGNIPQPDVLGNFTYTPTLGYAGPDSFTYQVQDPNNPSQLIQATVLLTVNAAPVTANPDSYTANENQTLTAASVLANDSIPAGETGTATLVAGSGPSHAASFTLNPDGTFIYTPITGFAGLDSFTYLLTDTNNQTQTAVVTLNVQAAAPVAVTESYSTNENATRIVTAAQGVLINDTYPAGDPITNLVFQTITAQGGTIAGNLDGSFVYTPLHGFWGIDSFSYTITTSNGVSASVTDTLVVNEIAPVAFRDIIMDVKVNKPANVTIAVPGILGNDLNPGNNPRAHLVSGVRHGTLTLNADGSLTYNAKPGFIGLDSFSYYVKDAAGTLRSNIVTDYIVVARINLPTFAAPVVTSLINKLTASLDKLLEDAILTS